jgi:hypothetical protein
MLHQPRLKLDGGDRGGRSANEHVQQAVARDPLDPGVSSGSG